MMTQDERFEKAFEINDGRAQNPRRSGNPEIPRGSGGQPMNETLYRTHLHAAVTDYVNRLRKTEGLFPVDTETFNQHVDRIPRFAHLFFGIPRQSVGKDDIREELYSLGVQPEDETDSESLTLKIITKNVVTHWWESKDARKGATGFYHQFDVEVLDALCDAIAQRTLKLGYAFTPQQVLEAVNKRIIILSSFWVF